MFDVGLMEIAVILVVAMLALGPERLPIVAKQAAKFVHQARKMAMGARDELRSELGPEYADLRLQDLDPRNIVRKHIAEAMADVNGSPEAAAPAFVEGQRPPYDSEAT